MMLGRGPLLPQWYKVLQKRQKKLRCDVKSTGIEKD